MSSKKTPTPCPLCKKHHRPTPKGTLCNAHCHTEALQLLDELYTLMHDHNLTERHRRHHIHAALSLYHTGKAHYEPPKVDWLR